MILHRLTLNLEFPEGLRPGAGIWSVEEAHEIMKAVFDYYKKKHVFNKQLKQDAELAEMVISKIVITFMQEGKSLMFSEDKE